MTGSARFPPSPEIAFAGGNDLSVPSHSHKDSVAKGNGLKPLFCLAILFGPSNGIFGSHNATRVADTHKPAVPPGDSSQPIVRIRFLHGPVDPIRRSQDGPFVSHRHEQPVTESHVIKGRDRARIPACPGRAIR